jgi:hypothetical protein
MSDDKGKVSGGERCSQADESVERGPIGGHLRTALVVLPLLLEKRWEPLDGHAFERGRDVHRLERVGGIAEHPAIQSLIQREEDRAPSLLGPIGDDGQRELQPLLCTDRFQGPGGPGRRLHPIQRDSDAQRCPRLRVSHRADVLAGEPVSRLPFRRE